MKKAKDPFFTLFSPVIRNKICGEIINRFIKPCKTIGQWSRSREKINQILGGGRRKKNPRGPPARNGPRDILLLPYHPIRNAGNGGFEKKNGFTWVNTFFPPLATLDKDISRAGRMAGRRFARERWQGMARRRKNGTWAAVVKDARHPARGTKRSRNDRGNYLPIEGYRNATLTDRASFLDCWRNLGIFILELFVGILYIGWFLERLNGETQRLATN